MKKSELTPMLEEIAKNDLVDEADVYDHPCSVAIRMLDRCFADIAVMQRMISEINKDRHPEYPVLTWTDYNPDI